MGQVLVHTPWLGLGGCHGDALLRSIGEQVVTALEAVVEDRITPRGNDLDIGLQGVESQFETDLVITLAGAAVGNSEAALPLWWMTSVRRSSVGELRVITDLGNVDLGTGNDWTSQRSTYRVHVNTSIAGYSHPRQGTTYPEGRRFHR